MIFTVGHGARNAEDLLAILRDADVSLLAGVRACPVSRRHPQLSRPAISASLEMAGFNYHWYGKALGGLRKGGVCGQRRVVHLIESGERREHAQPRLF